jgi:RHS repeat-associated protein
LCLSFVQRTVWDGDQVLFEERHTGSDLTEGAPYYGTIGYIHGGGIDAPLWLLDTRFSDARVINYNWRGLAESSVWPNGNPADTSLTGGDATAISWPAGQGVYYRSAPPPGGALSPTWIGSLPSNGQDGTGMLYRRNRYYDPAAGRFTQEDPIGLAGGLNLYGFAQGDPVNFSDPFGLCIWDACIAEAIALGAVATGAIRFIANKLMGRPATENVVRDAVGGAAGMALLAGGGAALAARAAPIATAGSGLTGRIVDALENAGPDMAARTNAVLGTVPKNLTTLYNVAEDGVVTIQGGSGDNLRQIILRPDGSSVVKAFEAAKDAWRVVKEIKPQ